jgi:hypothetical protein
MNSYMHSQTPDDISKALQYSMNIPHNSEHCFEALKIFTELQRPSQNFGDLWRPLQAFVDLWTPSTTFGCLQTPIPTFWMPHGPCTTKGTWGMDKEIDPGWGGLTPIPLLH